MLTIHFQHKLLLTSALYDIIATTYTGVSSMCFHTHTHTTCSNFADILVSLSLFLYNSLTFPLSQSSPITVDNSDTRINIFIFTIEQVSRKSTKKNSFLHVGNMLTISCSWCWWCFKQNMTRNVKEKKNMLHFFSNNFLFLYTKKSFFFQYPSPSNFYE